MTAVALPPRCARSTGCLLLTLLLGPLLVGVLLGLDPESAAWARRQVPLGFSAPRPEIGDALAISVHNLRVIATPLLGATLLCWLRFTGRALIAARALLDVFLVFSVAANPALLTLSLAGYGPARMAPWLPHLPFEFAALALALSTYLSARRSSLKPPQLAAAFAACAALLTVAALLETYALPQH